MENRNTSGEGLLDLLPIIRILGINKCYSPTLGQCELEWKSSPAEGEAALKICAGDVELALDRYGRLSPDGEPIIYPQGDTWTRIATKEGLSSCWYLKSGDPFTPAKGYYTGHVYDADGAFVDGVLVSALVRDALERGYVTPEELGLAKPPFTPEDEGFKVKLVGGDNIGDDLQAKLDSLEGALRDFTAKQSADLVNAANTLLGKISDMLEDKLTRVDDRVRALYNKVCADRQNDLASDEPKTDGGEGEKVTITPGYKKYYLEGPVRVWVDMLSGTAERELMQKLTMINLDPESSVELIAISTLNSIDTRGPHWGGRIAWRTAKGASTFILTNRLKRLVYLYRGGEVSTTQFIEAWLRIVEECEELPGTCFRRGVRIGGDEPSAKPAKDGGEEPKIVSMPEWIGVPDGIVEGPVRDWLYKLEPAHVARILEPVLNGCDLQDSSVKDIVENTAWAIAAHRGMDLHLWEMADAIPADFVLWLTRIKDASKSLAGSPKTVIEMWLRVLEMCEKVPGTFFRRQVSPERMHHAIGNFLPQKV